MGPWRRRPVPWRRIARCGRAAIWDGAAADEALRCLCELFMGSLVVLPCNSRTGLTNQQLARM